MGEKQNQPFQLSFNPSLRVDFQGSRVTSDSGLLLVRELDERLGLSSLIAEHLTGDRRKNIQLPLPDLLRQSIYSRLAGYEDGMGVKSASCLKSKKRFRVKGIISKINISCAFVLIASSLFFAQQPASTLTKAPQDPPAQPQSPQPRHRRKSLRNSPARLHRRKRVRPQSPRSFPASRRTQRAMPGICSRRPPRETRPPLDPTEYVSSASSRRMRAPGRWRKRR